MAVVQWPGVFENYARKYVRDHYWRVRHLMSEEDALQECGVSFANCMRKASQAQRENPAWFMSFFKWEVAMDWHTLSRKDTRYRSHTCELTEEVEIAMANVGEEGYSALAEAWHSASDDLKTVIQALVEAPQTLLDLVFCDDKLPWVNQRLKRLAGIKGSADIIGELRTLLT